MRTFKIVYIRELRIFRKNCIPVEKFSFSININLSISLIISKKLEASPLFEFHYYRN